MTDTQERAIKKLADEKTAGLDKLQDYLAPHVRRTLTEFCRQSHEFAEAVMEESKSLSGCLKAMELPGQGLGYLSDFEVYRMAARYFFPDADVRWVMEIAMPEKKRAGAGVLNLRFEDLL